MSIKDPTKMLTLVRILEAKVLVSGDMMDYDERINKLEECNTILKDLYKEVNEEMAELLPFRRTATSF